MNVFKDIITLNKNSRGCYILDTVKGCGICVKEKPQGCYGNCYAKNIADRYRFDFTNPINRIFSESDGQGYFDGYHDTKHEANIVSKIKKIDMPFVRIGEMGDPSEDWNHTIEVCKSISVAKKPIVIITKHWKVIPDSLLDDIKKLNITINTSVSAMDNSNELDHRIIQYKRFAKYCNSVLRVVSCDFNRDNDYGANMAKIQDKLFEYPNIIDTIFRPIAKNKIVTSGIIKVKKMEFLKSNVLASSHCDNPYLGMCNSCPDMCGIK